jgi:hypothetical protein
MEKLISNGGSPLGGKFSQPEATRGFAFRLVTMPSAPTIHPYPWRCTPRSDLSPPKGT